MDKNKIKTVNNNNKNNNNNIIINRKSSHVIINHQKYLIQTNMEVYKLKLALSQQMLFELLHASIAYNQSQVTFIICLYFYCSN